MDSISWVEGFLTGIAPRFEPFAITEPFMEDECKWFRLAVTNQIIQMKQCNLETCRVRKKYGEAWNDEFIITKGKGGLRHLFSLSNPIGFNRECLPHIAAYTRAIIEFNFDQNKSSFMMYRKFQNDLINKKQRGWFETDAEFYDDDGNVYLHVEAKKSKRETEALADSIHRHREFSELNKKYVKELEYVLDIKPAYLWIVGPGSVDPAKYLYKVAVDSTQLNAYFEAMNGFPILHRSSLLSG